MPSRIRLAPNPLHDSGDEQRTEPCRTCEGTGDIRNGEWSFWASDGTNGRAWELLPCPDCHGTGKQPYWSLEARR